MATSDGSSSPNSDSIYGFSTPPSSWASTSSTLSMATKLPYSSSSRPQHSAKGLLPSVLAPNRTSAMPFPDAIQYLREQLALNPYRQPQPLIITVVFYDIHGRPSVVQDLDDDLFDEKTSLEAFVMCLQSMLDTKIGERRLLVSRFEFRLGGPRLPAIKGSLCGPKGQTVDWMSWPADGTQENHFFDLCLQCLQCGIGVSVEKPILKVRTVEYSGNDSVVADGHYFRELSEDPVSVTMNNPGVPNVGPSPSQSLAAKLQAKLPVDLTFDAPEFRLMSRFMDALKLDRRAELAVVYGQHLLDGQLPIKGLLVQGRNRDGSTSPRHSPKIIWIGPEHPAYSTVKPRPKEAGDSTIDLGFQEAREEHIGDGKQIGPYAKKEPAAYWFEDIDDETYFPAAGKGSSATLAGAQPVSESVGIPLGVSKRPAHGRVKTRTEIMTEVMNLKVLTQFPKTVATPSGTSPTRTFPSIYNPSTMSPQIAAANTPNLPPPYINRAGSPLKQITPTTSQLRAESPAFTFDSKSRLTNNAPAVAGLLRLIQKEGVTAAVSRKSSAESAGESGAPTHLPLQGAVASPSPLLPAVPEANTIHALPSYYNKQPQSQSQALDAVNAMTAQAQAQLHSQSQTSSASTTPVAQHPTWYTTLQAQTAAPVQNLPHPPASRGLRPATSRSSLNRHQTGPQRFPQNTGYYSTSGTSTPSSHNLVSGTTTLSFPTVAHPQPQTSAMAANAFKEYQAQFDKVTQVVASTSDKENDGARGPGDSKGFQFVFGNFSQSRRIKSPRSRK